MLLDLPERTNQKTPVPERDERYTRGSTLIRPLRSTNSALHSDLALNSAFDNGNEPVFPTSSLVQEYSYKGVNQKRNRREFQPSSLSLYRSSLLAHVFVDAIHDVQ
jgi:hypothetical protein